MTYVEAFERDMVALWSPRERIAKLQQRTARRELATRYSGHGGYWPLMRWLTELFPERPISVPWTLDEAARRLRKEVRRQRSLKSHWAYDAHRLSECRKRLVLARFFARYSQAIWARQAA